MTEQELRERIQLITEGPGLIVAAVRTVDDRKLRYKPDPKNWSILEILGHLADIEVLYGHRLRQMIADTNPTIAPIDQDNWANNLGYLEGSKEEFLQFYLTARQANLRLLRRLKPADLDKGAFHPEKNRKVTVAELLDMMAAHEPNHLGQILRLKQSAASGA